MDYKDIQHLITLDFDDACASEMEDSELHNRRWSTHTTSSGSLKKESDYIYSLDMTEWDMRECAMTE